MSRTSSVAIAVLAAATAGFALSPTGQATAEGSQVADVAEANGVSYDRARDLLADPTTRLTDDDRVYFVEPVRRDTAPTGTPALRVAAERSFTLQSKPGAPRTIFLDFDGHRVSGTVWNSQDGVSSGNHPGWDPGNNGAGFSNAELALVQDVFFRVAEDYSPFDVNVTTAAPPESDLVRTSAGDQRYGMRALVSESNNALSRICGGQCSGVALLSVFDEVGSASLQPAWIFPQTAGDSPKAIAETISHEVGHTVGLDHDGRSGVSEYYEGHNGWAPIMGFSDFQPITHWSKGEYSGATNGENDIAVMRSHGLTQRADEAGGSLAEAASSLPGGTAYISTQFDTDVYPLGRCSGSTTVRASVAPVSPNLDVRLTLLDAAGRQVAVADPTSQRVDNDRATGLDAAITRSLSAGEYYVSVTGTGRGNATNGYTNYASMGAYGLSVSGCDGAVDPVDPEEPQNPQDPRVTEPSKPTSVRARSGRRGGKPTISVRWSAPASNGGAAIRRYQVVVYRMRPFFPTKRYSKQVSGSKRSFSRKLPRWGRYVVRVRALNEAGWSPLSARSGRVRSR